MALSDEAVIERARRLVGDAKRGDPLALRALRAAVQAVEVRRSRRDDRETMRQVTDIQVNAASRHWLPVVKKAKRAFEKLTKTGPLTDAVVAAYASETPTFMEMCKKLCVKMNAATFNRLIRTKDPLKPSDWILDAIAARYDTSESQIEKRRADRARRMREPGVADREFAERLRLLADSLTRWPRRPSTKSK